MNNFDMTKLDNQIELMEKLTELVKNNRRLGKNKALAEAEFLDLFLPAVALPYDEKSSFVGQFHPLPIGHFAQVRGQGLGYYCLPYIFTGMMSNPETTQAQKEKLQSILDFWIENDTKTFIENQAGEKLTSVVSMVNIDHGDTHNEVVMPLYRLGGTQLNYPLLLELGIDGLIELIKEKVFNKSVCDAMCGALLTFQKVVDKHIIQLNTQKQKVFLSEANEILLKSLKVIRSDKPKTFHQALQLILLYAQCTASFNYGRLDDYLCEFYAKEKANNTLSDEEVLRYLVDFYDHISLACSATDGRFTVGGAGRRHGENADDLAMLMLEAVRVRKEVLPQITLRFDKNQNPKLIEKAFEMIAQGTTYPLLYNDDINIAAVEKAFDVNLTTAEQYLPYSCGEYIINHKSIGTPSGTLNVLKALEVTLFNGNEIHAGRKMGAETGEFTDFERFEDFYDAYKFQLARYIDAATEFQMLEYHVAGEYNAFLLVSILMDDCLEKSTTVLSGGVHYLGGSLECYGNTNVADSLAAIKRLVFEKKLISQEDLLSAIKANFIGYEDIHKLLLNAPKYGNDDEYVDSIMEDLHQFICKQTNNVGKKVGMDGFLPVLINNSYNSTFGLITGASADGRSAGSYMANANNPAGGMDKSGITSMLNSILKLDPSIHAGYVQNLKLSSTMFKEHPTKTKALLDSYFKQGGTQLMITVLEQSDLKDAIKNPDKYPNLLVRVGGFTAKFVELPAYVQKEILSRTMY